MIFSLTFTAVGLNPSIYSVVLLLFQRWCQDNVQCLKKAVNEKMSGSRLSFIYSTTETWMEQIEQNLCASYVKINLNKPNN